MSLLEKLELSQDEFIKIRDFIYEKSGMFFADSKKYLVEDRILRRMEEIKIEKFENYYYFIKYDPGKEQELVKLFDEVTTNETYFYRNLPQIEALQEIILPEIIEQKKKMGIKTLKLWSAACSSGEEPFTMAMVLDELLGPTLKTWNIQIIGTDISNAILEKAAEALYNKNSLRSLPEDKLPKYFDELPDGNYKIKDHIKKMVEFQNVNLIDRMKMRMIRDFDVIFCRNVLIYFDVESKKQVISSLYNSLSANSYLFIGHSESLHGISTAFKLVHLKNAMVYKKEKIS